MSNNCKPDKVLDCSGLCCSLPLVEARSELDKMTAGQLLELIADYPSAEVDINALVRLKSYELIRMWKADDGHHFLIKKVN
jgi:tRNA 2-thiouridine synthesizing protein A